MTRRGGDLVVGDRTGLESLTGYGVRSLRPIADTAIETVGVGPGGAVLLRGVQAMHYMR